MSKTACIETLHVQDGQSEAARCHKHQNLVVCKCGGSADWQTPASSASSSCCLVQMEDFIVMSRSGFSYSAAYTALPRRAAWLDKNAEDCSFIDYDGKCLGMACPGQMGDSHFARQAFNLGPYET